MTSGLLPDNLLRGLAFRVLFLLSLAMLPIGMISAIQSQQISEQNRVSGELSLLAVTEQASSAERRVLQRAFGAAEALISIAKLHRDAPEDCAAFFEAYRSETGEYGLAGFVRPDGVIACSSAGVGLDLGAAFDLEAFLTEKPSVSRVESMPVVTGSDMSIVVKKVVEDAGETLGYILLSIPVTAIHNAEEPQKAAEPLATMTFNAIGGLLTSENGPEVAQREAPSVTPTHIAQSQIPFVFRAENLEGVERVYAVQPIVAKTAYAITVWPVNSPFLTPNALQRMNMLLPIAMWAASLVVAFLALNRLAIRHIRKLVRQMHRFAVSRELPEKALGPNTPSELIAMETSFLRMGESILRDEAQLEDSLREKNILLKEVHHRVKNNLQMISSIMNMQMREVKNPATEGILRRLQDRILSLAAVHRHLYLDDNLNRVDAKGLLEGVTDQLLSVGLPDASLVEITKKFEGITIDADDAAPLTLLASESLTNALKHVGNSDGAFIQISLTRRGEEMAVMEVANSVSSTSEAEEVGLGSRLIDAFARQLNGHITVDQTDVSYVISVRFPIPQTVKQVHDF